MTPGTPDEQGAGSPGLMLRLAVLIVGMGVIALSLLSYRQLRLQAIHEQSDARLRQTQQDKELWTLRSEIALRTTPEQVGVVDVDYAPVEEQTP
ncbi:MAG: hypothetical protein ED559_09230 [Phycisphaera sp.]|nr:MAG: hypothetical protein ED559_09230 [Phycisphaera sp.]